MIEKWVMILVGVAFLLGGYTLYRLGIRAMGGYLGALAGMGFWRIVDVYVLNVEMSPNEEMAGLVISAAVFGIIGALLAVRFYMVLIFLATFLGGLYIVYAKTPGRGLQLFELFQETVAFQWLYGRIGDAAPALVVFIISLLLLLLHRHFIIIATCVMGAYIVSVRTFPYLFPALLVVGLFSQLTGGRRYLTPRQADDD